MSDLAAMARETAFDAHLREHADRHFTLVEVRGNSGDKLIHTGLRARLDELGIDYDRVAYQPSPRDSPLRYVRRGYNRLTRRTP